MRRSRATLWTAALVALLCGASTLAWDYYILNAARRAPGVAGNASDLYPRWHGARELLLHGRNPYSADVTREIQQGYYGRALRPEEAHLRDRVGFAYPVHTVFFLAPFMGADFALVQIRATLVLLGLTALSMHLWLAALRANGRQWWTVAALFACASWPVVQGLRLQQPALWVAFLIAASIYAAHRGWLVASGAVLACATVKPHAVLPVLVWLAIWTAIDVRARWRLLGSFTLTTAALLAAAEVLAPGWIPRFIEAVRAYRTYAPSRSLVESFAGEFSLVATVAIAALVIWLLWRMRRAPLANGAALALAASLPLMPHWMSYNQVALLPMALLLFAAKPAAHADSRRLSLWRALCGMTVSWQWLAAALVVAAWLAGVALPVYLPLYTIQFVPLAFAGAAAYIALRTVAGSQ